MASSTRIFFAGVGTTFAILAVGFGGGILMANFTLSGTSAQKQASSEPLAAARIVHPNSAEPALQVAASVPTEPSAAAPPRLATQAAADPTVPVTAPSPNLSTPSASASQSQLEERSKTRRELRAERRQRYAERRARRHRQLVSPGQRDAGIMAFEGDGTPSRTGFFGN
jgi:type IV secretory pathway VirB10-like protein